MVQASVVVGPVGSPKYEIRFPLISSHYLLGQWTNRQLITFQIRNLAETSMDRCVGLIKKELAPLWGQAYCTNKVVYRIDFPVSCNPDDKIMLIFAVQMID